MATLSQVCSLLLACLSTLILVLFLTCSHPLLYITYSYLHKCTPPAPSLLLTHFYFLACSLRFMLSKHSFTSDLAENCQFEEIAYLLIYGRLPTADELREYIRTLASLRELPGALKDILERIPANAHPMVCWLSLSYKGIIF